VDSTFRRHLKAELFSRAYGVSMNTYSSRVLGVFHAAGLRVRFGLLDGACRVDVAALHLSSFTRVTFFNR